MIIQTTNGPLEYFLRDSKKGKIKVLGKETDTYICNTCKNILIKKIFTQLNVIIMIFVD